MFWVARSMPCGTLAHESVRMFSEVRRDGERVFMRECIMSMVPNSSPSLLAPVINGSPTKMYPTDKSKGEVVSVVLNGQGEAITTTFTANPPTSSVYGDASWRTLRACTHNANSGRKRGRE